MDRISKKNIFAFLILGGSCVLLVWTLLSRLDRRPKMRLEPYQAAGERAAQEIATLTRTKGRILVIVEDFGEYNMAWAAEQLEAFKKGLNKHGVQLAAVEKVTDPMISEAARTRFSAADFAKMLRNHPGIDGVVIFANFPPNADQEFAVFAAAQLRVVTVSNYGPGLKRLLETKSVQVAIVPRDDPATVASKSRSSAAWFDAYYRVLTPDHVPPLDYSP